MKVEGSGKYQTRTQGQIGNPDSFAINARDPSTNLVQLMLTKEDLTKSELGRSIDHTEHSNTEV